MVVSGIHQICLGLATLWHSIMGIITKAVGPTEVKNLATPSGGMTDSDVYSQDTDDEEHSYSSDLPKLQFRKDISKALWKDALGLAEVLVSKGRIFSTTGIVRRGKVYCSIEETLFLAEVGALHLLDDDDKCLSLEDIYLKIAEGRGGCSWESFQVYRHLKSLGYIVARHGVPWTMKSVKGSLKSVEGTSEIIQDEDNSFICDQFNSLHLIETRLRLLFDVYPPKSNFKKSSPGNPSFVLCLVSGHPPSKSEIEDLQRDCDNSPLKFCHVEHGRVSFFSFNKMELPVLP